MTNRLRLVIIALASLGVLTPVSSRHVVAASSRALHNVTGSGVIDVFPGFVFTMTVAAQVDEDGNAWGTVTGRSVDTSAFGIFGPALGVFEVRCMRVVDNVAFLGLRLTHVTSPILGAPGGLAAAWVVDQGGNGEDIAYNGPSGFLDPFDQICSDTPPPMPPTVASPGNFTVR